MAILLDGSAVLAAADRADLNHAAAVAWFRRANEPLLLGALTLAELDVLLQRELGPAAIAARLRSITDGALRLVTPTTDDLARAAELLGRPPSTARASPTPCSSRPASGSGSGASRRSTGDRWRSSGRATCGPSTSSPSAARRANSKRARRRRARSACSGESELQSA